VVGLAVAVVVAMALLRVGGSEAESVGSDCAADDTPVGVPDDQPGPPGRPI
jgi:hypothetical protein